MTAVSFFPGFQVSRVVMETGLSWLACWRSILLQVSRVYIQEHDHKKCNPIFCVYNVCLSSPGFLISVIFPNEFVGMLKKEKHWSESLCKRWVLRWCLCDGEWSSRQASVCMAARGGRGSLQHWCALLLSRLLICSGSYQNTTQILFRLKWVPLSVLECYTL